MEKIAVLCIDGVEEIECLTVADFCRRAGIGVTMVSVTGENDICGSHEIVFRTDALTEDTDFEEFDGIVYPGGPATKALGEVPGVRELAKKFLDEGKMLAAICAAPGMLSESGLLKGRTAAGFPGCRPLGMAEWTDAPAERDGNLITGRGAGCASLFALEIIRYLCGEKEYEEVRSRTVMPF